MTADSERWRQAQDYERRWWEAHGGDYDWYRGFSQEIAHALAPIRPVSRETVILEIGSGPAGGLTYLDSDHKYAVEPLEPYFGSLPEVRAIRDPRVVYATGRGEALPYGRDFFDLVIIDNVLDHCEDPERVLDETDRVLKPSGLIYFRQHVYHPWGRFVRRLMELARIDRGHPHTFGRGYLAARFSRRGWTTRAETHSGFAGQWMSDIRAGSPKRRVKALLGVTADRAVWVLEKG